MAEVSITPSPATGNPTYSGRAARKARSFSGGVEMIAGKLGVRAGDFVAVLGRAKQLLKHGFLPNYAPGKGRAGELSDAELHRIEWALRLNLCGIDPASIVAMLRSVSDEEVSGSRLIFVRRSAYSNAQIEITVSAGEVI